MYCQVEFSALDWSHIHRGPAKCGVYECELEASIMRSTWSTRACCTIKKNYCIHMQVQQMIVFLLCLMLHHWVIGPTILRQHSGLICSVKTFKMCAVFCVQGDTKVCISSSIHRILNYLFQNLLIHLRYLHLYFFSMIIGCLWTRCDGFRLQHSFPHPDWI
jgi:hypothetical protein